MPLLAARSKDRFRVNGVDVIDRVGVFMFVSVQKEVWMFYSCPSKQQQIIMWWGVLILVLVLVPVGARAATLLAAISANGVKLECENLFQSIGGEDVIGNALILGLDLNYEVPIDPTTGASRGRVVNNPVGMRKNLDACTPLLFQALVQQQQMQVILTIFDANPQNGITQAKTRITLDNASIVGVEATGTASSTDPQMTTTQELVRVLAQRVIVDDLVAGTSFQYDFVAGR
jgi:type VI secretion system Hcp family effector